ncbi:hypothetical protein ABW19_dt0204045 [Dactylella cylindrospora]|nr:hypothetical protein ABW19_dt0204045 [Dactylella cylindrospora]
MSSAEAKYIKSQKWPPEFSKKVDMRKVNIEIIKQWITNRVSELLKSDDDVLIELIFGMLEGETFPDPKGLQWSLTGFLEQDTPAFCKELWELMLDAQSQPQGIPKRLIEAKKEEMRKEKPGNNEKLENRKRNENVTSKKFDSEKEAREANEVNGSEAIQGGEVVVEEIEVAEREEEEVVVGMGETEAGLLRLHHELEPAGAVTTPTNETHIVVITRAKSAWTDALGGNARHRAVLRRIHDEIGLDPHPNPLRMNRHQRDRMIDTDEDRDLGRDLVIGTTDDPDEESMTAVVRIAAAIAALLRRPHLPHPVRNPTGIVLQKMANEMNLDDLVKETDAIGTIPSLRMTEGKRERVVKTLIIRITITGIVEAVPIEIGNEDHLLKTVLDAHVHVQAQELIPMS